MNNPSLKQIVIVVCLLVGPALVYVVMRTPLGNPLRLRMSGRRTVDDRLSEFGEAARQRLAGGFGAAGVAYPPVSVTLAAFKNERRLELYVPAADGKMRFIKSYPFTAASGKLGPKLRQGDLQVPEGVYRITFLNANSAYHASLRVDYPNATDKANAVLDARSDLGGDIMIHGRAASIGCIAIGDPAIEEVFTLSADVGIGNIKCIIAPMDTRVGKIPEELMSAHTWIRPLYGLVEREIQALPSSIIPR